MKGFEEKKIKKQINPTRYFRKRKSGYGLFLLFDISRFLGCEDKITKKMEFCVKIRDGRKKKGEKHGENILKKI